MGRGELMGRAVRPAKCDRDIKLSAGHHEHVGRVVHHLIECDEGKAERHEFDDRSQADHRRADPKAGETVFADWGVDDARGTKAFEQSLADFVSAVVFGHFLTHEENIRVALQFFRERFVECLTISDFSHALGRLT